MNKAGAGSLAAFLGVVLAAAVASGAAPTAGTDSSDADVASEPPIPQRVDEPGLENAYRLDARIISGSEPRGRAGFESLVRLGVVRVISVDGATPRHDMAREFGIEYAHLPIGYKDLRPGQNARILNASRTDGIVYVHCYYGHHRGPTAAALIMMTRGWLSGHALAWMQFAGVSPHYRDLYRTVARFEPPPSDFVDHHPWQSIEDEPTNLLVHTMATLNRHWDALRAFADNGFPTDGSHPDLRPRFDIGAILKAFQALKEDAAAARTANGEKSVLRELDFTAAIERAMAFAQMLERQGSDDRRADRDRLRSAFDAAAQTCVDCHTLFRDN